ncbi:MAG: hypothetical protein CSA79_00290 [Thiothrix nivea]|nr:MAG: hypothetical protein CSA79_00290 [Thiothrix nivea]
MLPVLNSSGGSDEKKLRERFRQLSERDRRTLLRFADFLAASGAADELMTEFPVPEEIERPEQESVVKAIKRLTATYPMINKDKLLPQASDLMAAHLINGRAATDVIDELEAVFAGHYQQLKNEFEQHGE